ncbi:MAG: hypothetical protein WAW75_03255 [Gallionella sp.]
MKHLASTLFVLAMLSMSGCATSTYSVGRDFPTEQVSKIVRSKTTSAELKQMFGEPFSKTVVSETEEKWLYTHSSGSAHAQSFVFTMKVETTGQQKTLDILLKGSIVTNYTFTEGPSPMAIVK